MFGNGVFCLSEYEGHCGLIYTWKHFHENENIRKLVISLLSIDFILFLSFRYMFHRWAWWRDGMMLTTVWRISFSAIFPTNRLMAWWDCLKYWSLLNDERYFDMRMLPTSNDALSPRAIIYDGIVDSLPKMTRFIFSKIGVNSCTIFQHQCRPNAKCLKHFRYCGRFVTQFGRSFI